MANRYGFKIRTKNPKGSVERSIEIIKIVGKYGFFWATPPSQQNLREPYLFFDIEDKDITYMPVRSKGYFENHEFDEITLEELKEKNFSKKVKKLRILCNLEDEKTN